jgi:hypothetical protein
MGKAKRQTTCKETESDDAEKTRVSAGLQTYWAAFERQKNTNVRDELQQGGTNCRNRVFNPQKARAA